MPSFTNTALGKTKAYLRRLGQPATNVVGSLSSMLSETIELQEDNPFGTLYYYLHEV